MEIYGENNSTTKDKPGHARFPASVFTSTGSSGVGEMSNERVYLTKFPLSHERKTVSYAGDEVDVLVDAFGAELDEYDCESLNHYWPAMIEALQMFVYGDDNAMRNGRTLLAKIGELE